MTRQRTFGSDTEFSSWMRQNKSLPSSEFVATDQDFWIHKYLSYVDGQGTRDIQAIQFIEIKTRGGSPTRSQQDTLAKVHFCNYQKLAYRFGNQAIRNFGVSILSLSGTSPDDSLVMRWGRFHATQLRWIVIDRGTLEGLLSMDLHPDTLASGWLRRHHKTTKIVVTAKTPLGFTCEETVTSRS